VKDDDYVSIVVDPTGNLRRKYEFRVNPHGTKADILQDTVSNRYIYDWDTRWTAEAAITDSGYVVEMEIPLDSIRHPKVKPGESASWLVILKRAYPRAVDRTFGSVFTFRKDSPHITAGSWKRVEIKPYYIFHRDEDRKSGEEFEQTEDHSKNEIGIDAKLVIDSATAVAVTINPNYTEVEADIARESINNTFTPFQPEKRDFFQDSRELYSTLMPTVYTRNIIEPDYGLDLSHVGQRSSSGGLWISDKSTKLIMPDNLGSEKVEVDGFDNHTMAFRYMSGEKGSATGLIGTVRTGTDYSNYVAGVDGLVNLGLDDKFRYQLMYSWTEYPEEFVDDLCDGDDCLAPPPDDCPLGECDYNAAVLRANPTRDLGGHGIRLAYKHDGPEGLYWFNYFDYGADFRSDLGLDKRTDYRSVNAAYGKKWYFQVREKDKGKSRIRAYLVGNHIESSDGDTIEDGVDVWGEFRGSFQTVFRLGYRIKDRAVNRIDQGSLALGDNAPLFDESYWQWYYEASPISYLTFHLDGRYGDIADPDNLVLGKMTELKPKISVVTGRMKFQASHTYRDYDLDGSRLYSENFTTIQWAYVPRDRHVVRLLLLLDKTDRDTARYLGDEVEFEKETTLQFTYLYRKSSGLSVLAGINVTREEEDGIENFTSEREAFIKFVYDFGRRFNIDDF
jgi:hypothetical protein